MEESISSSRTSAFYGNNYDYCNYHYHQKQPPAPAPAPAPAPSAPAAAAASDFEDADSGWTTYFLQLDSDEEEDVDTSVSASASREKQQLRDAAATPCGTGRGSVSTVSKPNKAKDNKQAVKKVLKKGVNSKKTKEVLHLVGTTRIVEEEEEEDPLQDTASSPLVQLNINGGDLQACMKFGALLHCSGCHSITSSRDRPPVQRRSSGGDINGNGRIQTYTLGHLTDRQ